MERHMDPNTAFIEDPLAALEIGFIDQFLALRGFTRHSVGRLPRVEAARVLSSACEYASLRLAEIESRAHYVDEMHCPS
jgi:hypothetical protein